MLPNEFRPEMSSQSFPSYEVLGARLSGLDLTSLLSLLNEAIREDRHFVVANHNMHSLFLQQHSSAMRKFMSAATCTVIDGMAVVALGRLYGHSIPRKNRLACLDYIDPLLREAEIQGWRVFHLGNAPSVGTQAKQKLMNRYPKLKLETSHGHFDQHSPENNERLELIRKYKPNILLVGMGMPIQEEWIVRNYGAITANVVITVGGLFDYIAGAQPTPPRWLGQMGLEWLFRLAHSPRRLGARYLVEPLRLAPRIVKDLWARNELRG